MRIPNADKLRIDETKIKDYLLNTSHPDGSSKAVFFMRFGFNLENWQGLSRALKNHAAANEVASTVESDYGIRYSIDGKLETPDKRNPMVRTVWIIEKGDMAPRLITVHPV